MTFVTGATLEGLRRKYPCPQKFDIGYGPPFLEWLYLETDDENLLLINTHFKPISCCFREKC